MLTSTKCVEDDGFIQQIMQIMESLIEDAAAQSKTGKLWVENLKQVTCIRCFIFAERKGIWSYISAPSVK